VLRDGILCNQVAQSSLELQIPLTKHYSHAAQELRLWARTDLGETPDLEGHIPHGTPDDGIMPPGPSSETLSQDDSNDNHGNEGPDYPGDLDDKSPESSPPSTRPPSRSALPPP